MRLPGFDTVVDGVGKVVRRFPFSMLMALIGTASAYSLVHFEMVHDEWSLYRLLMTAVLGFLLYAVIQLKLEREKIKGSAIYIVQLLAAAFLALYYWQLPADFDFAGAEFVIRFFLLGLALLFSLTFIPFIRHSKEINGFWQYCKILFIRLFLTFVFTGTLYIGLVLALVATKELLGVDFDEKLFLELWIVIVGLISTSFFLLGIPEKTSMLQRKTDYHKGIQVFAEYILTPLILIYAVILYIYTGKIIVHWDWPEGMVSWLIIVFSMGSILANFMLYPLLKKERWARSFSYISYGLVTPMTVVMFMALKIRIDDYGITEPRYYGVVLCFWLLGISLYFILSKKKNLIILPVTLLIITLISSTGPLSSMNISKWSQMGRLETALIENGILVDTKVIKTDKELSKEDVATISGALDYVYQVHGIEALQPWFKEDLKNLNTDNCWGTQCVMNLMGVDYINRWERRPMSPGERASDYRSYYVNEMEPLRIEGYREIAPFHISGYEEMPVRKPMDVSSRFRISRDTLLLTYQPSDEEKVVIPLKGFLENLSRIPSQQVKWEQMTVDQGKIGLAFRNINLELDDKGEIQGVMFLDGYLMTK